jgi:hypothetical protein
VPNHGNDPVLNGTGEEASLSSFQLCPANHQKILYMIANARGGAIKPIGVPDLLLARKSGNDAVDGSSTGT